MPPRKKRKRGNNGGGDSSGRVAGAAAAAAAMEIEPPDDEGMPNLAARDDDDDEEDSDSDSDDEDNIGSALPQQKQSAAVKEVMGMCIGDKAIDAYGNENANFALWLYSSDFKEQLLESWFIEGLENAAQVAGGGGIGNKKAEKAMRKYAKQTMIEVHEDDSNCPICLKELGFEVYSEYLAQRKPKRGKNKGKAFALTKSVYDKSRSGLKHLYRMSRTKRPKEFKQKVKQFISGLTKKVASEKVKRGDAGKVGKKKMNYATYRFICEKMMEEEEKEFIFARLFLILEWNLMARSESVVNAHVKHIYWSEDALVFQFAKTKTDQFGTRDAQRWHVYSTPDCPATCPVLAMAQYIFTFPDTICSLERDGAEKMRLFPGNRQYDRFMYCLHQIVDKYTGVDEDGQPKELTLQGISKGDFGSHSARKGACSYAASGSTSAPPLVSICLRACWSLGPVKERYLQYEAGGDQYLGQVVSGRDLHSVNFAKSPPYFHAGDDTKKRIVSLIRAYLPNGDELPADRLYLIQMCLASLCYHRKFLDSNMHKRNQLRSSQFFKNMPAEYVELAEVRLPWNAVAGITPNVTGQPVYMALMVEIASLKRQMKQSEQQIIDAFRKDLDERHVGSQAHFEGNRVIAMLEKRFDELLQATTNIPAAGQSVRSENEATNAASDSSYVEVRGGVNTAFRFKIFLHSNGSYSRLPENFVMPSMGLQQLITAWYCGDYAQKIVPYKQLKAHEFEGTNVTKSKQSDMKKMMSLVEDAAGLEGVQVNRSMKEWTVPLTISLYVSVKKYFNYDKSLDGRGRNPQISYKTTLNHWHNKEKKFANSIA